MRIRIVVAALVALLIGMPARAANYTDWWWRARSRPAKA